MQMYDALRNPPSTSVVCSAIVHVPCSANLVLLCATDASSMTRQKLTTPIKSRAKISESPPTTSEQRTQQISTQCTPMLSACTCPFRSHISPSSSKAPGADDVDTEKTSVEKTEASHGDSPLLPSRCAMSLSALAAAAAAAASATSPATCSCMPNASAGLEVFARKSQTAN